MNRALRRAMERAEKKPTKPSAYDPNRYERGHIPMTIRHFGDNDLQITPHQCLADFSTESDWHTLAKRLNWGYVASARFDESRPGMEQALLTIAAVKGRFEITQEERLALAHGLELCDIMQGMMTRREMRDDMHTMLALNANTNAMKEASR